MFLGKVLRLTYEGGSPHVQVGPNAFRMARRTYTFSVAEAFSGAERAGEEVSVETGAGGGDCGYGFVVGEHYFVAATVWEGKLTTSICSPTAPEWEATLLLREMRAAANGSRLPDLSGVVLRRTPGVDWDTERPTPLSGLRVTATSAEGAPYKAVTDTEGVYQMQALPSGKYSVHFDLPAGMMAATYQRQPVEIDVPAANGTGAACHASFNASPAGRIPGQVVDPNGKPLPGEVFACALDLAGQQARTCAGTATVDKEGAFEIAPLAAGTYTLEFRLYNDYRRITYYPGTKDKSGAQPIMVPDGEATPPLRFIVTP